jgi:hypothetical protein
VGRTDSTSYEDATAMPKRRTSRLLILLVLLLGACGVGLGAFFSYSMWGYWFLRPPIPREITTAASLRHVTPLVATGKERLKGSQCNLAVNPTYSVAEKISYARQDPYYGHEGRLLLALEEKGFHPAVVSADARLDAPQLYGQLVASGLLVRGFDASPCLDGVALEVLNGAGKRILILGLYGYLRGDTHAYYELAFTLRHGGGWELGSEQHYFFDVAGAEGLEWPVLHGLVAVVGMTLGVLVWFGWMLATSSFGVMQRGA